jgi:protease I
MDITGKSVAILVHNYFEQAEFEEPLSALKNAGALVTVITASEDKKLQGLQHVKMGDTFTADLTLEDATPEDYDAVVLPGGAINADNLRMNETAQAWVRDFLDDERPVAAICHAPWVLVSADVLDGRRLTSFYTIQDDIRNAGGDWVDQKVVIDGSLITSRKPDDLPSFNDALISMLAKQPPVEAVDIIETTGSTDDTQALDERATEDDVRLRALGYDKRRDHLSKFDQQELLEDEDETDPDESRLRSSIVGDERDESLAQ